MRVAVINVPSKVGEPAWEQCFRLTAARAPIFGVNESFLLSNKATYRRLAAELKLGKAGLSTSPNPIFWRHAHYDKVSAAVHQLHPRGTSVLARRFPGFNDARSVTELVLRDKMDGDEYAVLNTHWVPEGRKVPGPWRAWARMEAARKLRRLIRKHLRAGRVVYFMGDTNIGGPLDFKLRRFHWLRPDGIDKIGVGVPKGVQLTAATFRIFAAPTDHKHGVVARADFTRST